MKTIALIGNPNSGKTSLFNELTGLRQKTGNFPGVTTEKVFAKLTLSKQDFQLVDLPGTYSLYPISQDEHVVTNFLLNPKSRPDGIIYVADINKIDQHLLLYSQISDLGLPLFLVLTMSDLKEQSGAVVNLKEFSRKLNTPITEISLLNSESILNLKTVLADFVSKLETAQDPIYPLTNDEKFWISNLSSRKDTTDYGKLLIFHHYKELNFLTKSEIESIGEAHNKYEINSTKCQVEETLRRFDKIEEFTSSFYGRKPKSSTSNSFAADKILTHSIGGPLIFLGILFIILQAIFLWAEAPMEFIESAFSWLSVKVSGMSNLGFFGGLLSDGIIPGIAGVMVFIPQIAILFFLLSLLEESGYMARAVYLFDNLMRRFGLNGRSLVALISGSACAIPAIMSARSINNEKERLITIMATPFISCSARTPVYIVLTGFVVGSGKLFGWISLSGLVFMSFYLLGIIAAFLLAYTLKKILKSNDLSYLLIELPNYQWPRLKTVLFTTWNKVRSFIVEAGKIIFFISIILWILSSYGPGDHRKKALELSQSEFVKSDLSESEKADFLASKELELSYAGKIGKFMEPAIAPLGFDWKIGIALITSFAAREVFVSTMATIYSLGSEDDEINIRNRMAQDKNELTGKPTYNRAAALSLIVFYILAMQCMSTLAVVRKETGSWKWPIMQFVIMTGSAYVASLIIYQLLG